MQRYGHGLCNQKRDDESVRDLQQLETVIHPDRGARNGMGVVFQNSRVVGLEEEPLNGTCGQRGNIAGNKLYHYF